MLRRGMMAGGASLPAGLNSEILADSPFMYLRLGESSGTNADNDAGATDGTYSGSYTLGNSALYTGGPTSMALTASTGRCNWPGASVPSLSAFTAGVIIRPDLITSIRHVISRDRDGGGSRFWQWRMNGSNLEFIKIVGGVQSVTVAHGMTSATAYMLHLKVDSSGNVKMFKNGVQLGSTGSISAANYGNSDTTDISIGNRSVANEAQVNDRFSEAFVIASAISDSRIAAHASAAGF